MQSRGTTILQSPIPLLPGLCCSGPDGWLLPDRLFSAIINVSLWPHIGSTSKLLLTANTASCVGLAVLTACLWGQMDITPCEQINNPSLSISVLMCWFVHRIAIWERRVQWIASDDCAIMGAEFFCRDESVILIQAEMYGSAFPFPFSQNVPKQLNFNLN